MKSRRGSALWERGAAGRAAPLLHLWIALLLAFSLLAVPLDALAERPNGAGLVIQHGDGRVLYIYVEFTEPQITGIDLLSRSGLPLELAGYGGLGGAVCRIDNEGCPADNCFCRSYETPSWFWRYHRLNADGSWSALPVGPASRVIHDGDVDGWSWATENGQLASTSIDQIAALNGLDRSVPAPLPPAAPAEPTATEPPPPPPPAAPAPPADADDPTPIPTPTSVPPAAEAAPAPTPTPSLPPDVPSPTPTQAAPPTSTAATTTASPAAGQTTASATATDSPVARAVEVDATGTVRPVDLSAEDDADTPGTGTIVGFATMLAAVAGAGAWIIYRRRRTS